MSGTGTAAVGSISWVDLTVADAPGGRDFYAAVTGWKAGRGLHGGAQRLLHERAGVGKVRGRRVPRARHMIRRK